MLYPGRPIKPRDTNLEYLPMLKAMIVLFFVPLSLIPLAGCGDNEKPPELANVATPGKVCTEAARVCPMGDAPTVDPNTCKQSCLGD